MPELFNKHQFLYCCSWCGKNQQNNGVRVVPGPGVYICEECVQICIDILDNWLTVIGRGRQ